MTTQEKDENAKRPGVMLYFDMVDPLLLLRDSEKGRMLMAIMAYARDGTPPQFTGKLALAWGYIQPKLDRDAEVYDNTVQKRKYAAICKKRAGLNLPKITFSQWKNMTPEELEHMDAHGNTWYPTGKGQGDGTREETRGETREEAREEAREEIRNGYAAAAAAGYGNAPHSAVGAAETEASSAAAAAERKLKKLNGELGQGVVNLSEYHIDRLLDQMGLEMFDYYVKKLSDFILKNDASVKNHYTTILRWWQEDNAL